jgi:hypothetical protein
MSIVALRTITPATEYPITLSEAKSHIRITYTAEDTYIQSLIVAATDWAQQFTRRIFIDTQVGIRMDRFPASGDAAELQGDPQGQWFYIRRSMQRKKEAAKRDQSILLPGGFVSAINDIDYIDVAGAPQTLTGPTSAAPGTDYQEDLTDDEWCFIYPNSTTGWPGVDSNAVNAVLIDYQVGWPTRDDVPESICQAIRFKVADFFTIRDTVDAGSRSGLLQVAENLLDPWIVPHH